jgi:hypothetical protein
LVRSAGSGLQMIVAVPVGRHSSPPHQRMRSRRVVEKKETKKRLGRSPDDVDAMNLAYCELGFEAPYSVNVPIYDDRTLGPRSDAAWNDQIPIAQKRRARFGGP